MTKAAINKNIFNAYIDSWLNKDLSGFKKLLSDKTKISECYGACYLGVEEATQWFSHWNDNPDNKVISWKILSSGYDITTECSFFEWDFHYKYKGIISTFAGVTLLKTDFETILFLKEFESTIKKNRPYQRGVN